MPRTSPGIRDIGLADWLFAKNQQFPWIDHCPASTKCVIEAAGMAERMRGDRLQPSYRPSVDRASRRPCCRAGSGARRSLAIEQVQGWLDEVRTTHREFLDVQCSQHVDRRRS